MRQGVRCKATYWILRYVMSFTLTSDLLEVPPGFSSGMHFERKKLGSLMTGLADPSQLNLAHILATADDIDLLGDDTLADVNNQEEEETGERKELLQEEKVKDCLTAAIRFLQDVVSR